MWRLLSVHALALVMALSACEGGQRLAGVSDSTFVRTMAELRVVHTKVWPDSAAKAAALDSILQSRGLTPEQLEQASRELAEDPERAVEIWRAIDRHIRGDTLGPAEGQPPSAGRES
jgi:hypothetical protein